MVQHEKSSCKLHMLLKPKIHIYAATILSYRRNCFDEYTGVYSCFCFECSLNECNEIDQKSNKEE